MTGLPVAEVFGPVWQGEGPFTGQCCHFLRLGMCNLHCSWCDTPYTWDADRYDLDAEFTDRGGLWIAGQLQDVRLCILSGGEPLMHQGNAELHDGVSVVGSLHVETNGTITPNRWATDCVDHFTVSPKVAHQGDPRKRRLKDAPLGRFTELAQDGRAIFKVVVRTEFEVCEAIDFFETYRVPAHARWVMPEGITQEAVLDGARAIADIAAKHELNLSLRMHTLMYGTERGR